MVKYRPYHKIGRVERRRAGLDQWLPLCLPFRASWQMATRSCPRFPHPLGAFRTAGFPQCGWKPAWSSCTLPKPSPASFDAGLTFLSVSGSVSRRLGPRLYPQALGSARFIIPAPAIATTARSASLTNSVQLGPPRLTLAGLCPCGPFASLSLLCFVILLIRACRDLYPVG